MAFSAVTERGSATEKVSDTSLAVSPSAAITVGKIAFVYAVTDNTPTSSGNSTELSLADTDTHTWNKVFERTFAPTAAADVGVTHALWWVKVTSEIGTGDSITVTLATARTAKVLMVFEATITASTIQVANDGTPTAFQETTSDTPSVATSGMTSQEYFHLGALAVEHETLTWTEDSDYTNVFASEGVSSGPAGTPASNVTGLLGYRIATLTGDTFAPTYASADKAAALVAFEEVTSGQSLTGTLFTKAPTFPTGVVTPGAVALTGTLFTKAPTFPTGVVSGVGGTQNLSGVLFIKAPTFSVGVLTATRTLSGVLFTKAPTFPVGVLQHYQNLFVVELDDEDPPAVDTDHFLRGNARATAGAGWIRLRLFQAAALIAELEFQPTGSFATYEYELLTTEADDITDYDDLQIHVDVKGTTLPFTVEVDWVELERPPAVLHLAGTLFTKAPTFFAGTVTSVRALTGVAFPKAPTFFAGAVSSGTVLAGVLFQKAPTFQQGVVGQLGGPVVLSGVLFVKAPTFPAGTVTAGGVTVAGVLFQKAPTFNVGAVTTNTAVSGVLFTKAPTFNVGSVLGSQILTGTLFTKAPTFNVGTVGVAGTLSGVLFTKAPVFFVGVVSVGAPTFWIPNPAGYTVNPVAYVAVGAPGPSPWGAELSGIRFEKAPAFPVGAVT